ncbi:MAG: hypothetical protein KBS75_04460 [Bacteroidales bacterium]|nr:hypothetical protein [Candidatus Equimonas faecalis]
MEETEVLEQVVSPISAWDVVALAIGIVGAVVTVISVIVTIKSMHQAKKYKEEAEQYRNDAYTYKTQAAEQLRCLDMYAYVETVTKLMAEITRVPAKDNNNKAGKLSILFEHITTVVGQLTKYTTLFGDSEGKKSIEAQKLAITKFVINNQAEATVDIAALIDMFELTERLLRKEINDYQDKLNKA